MCALAADWLIPARLVEGHGNFGSPDYAPASARFTEARLTPAGMMVVESERGDLPRLPIGLVNGDMYAGGAAPSFDPSRVIDALSAAIDRPDLDDEDYAALVGQPVFPTGCSVAGEMAALRAAEPARLKLSARITVERVPRGSVLVINRLPLHIGSNEVVAAIREHFLPRVVHGHVHPPLAGSEPPGMIDVNDESVADQTRIVCRLGQGADEQAILHELSELSPVSVERTALLPAPLGALVRSAVDDDRSAQASALARLKGAIASQPTSDR